jgi:hypothetical protein
VVPREPYGEVKDDLFKLTRFFHPMACLDPEDDHVQATVVPMTEGLYPVGHFLRNRELFEEFYQQQSNQRRIK